MKKILILFLLFFLSNSIFSANIFRKNEIIGKIWEDNDKDGIQDDATAKNLKLEFNKIPQIISVTYNGEKYKDYKRVDKIVTLKELEGDSKTKYPNAIEIYINNSIKNNNNIVTLTTQEGVKVVLDGNDEMKISYAKSKINGSNQNIIISRRYIQTEDGKNYEILKIENNGKSERGIPGVRVMTLEGEMVITDKDGMYHLIYDSNNKLFNYKTVKIDELSLPKNSILTTENPIRSTGITNFGVFIEN